MDLETDSQEGERISATLEEAANGIAVIISTVRLRVETVLHPGAVNRRNALNRYKLPIIELNQ